MPKPRSTSSREAPHRRKRRPSNEVRALLLGAARAEFERAGYAGATTAAIAAGASATEAQLFRYFRSKAELFRAAVLDPLNLAFEEFNASRLEVVPQEESWPEQARSYIGELRAFVGDHEHLLMSLIVAQAYGGANVEGVAGVGGLKAYFDLGASTMQKHLDAPPRVDPALLVRVSFGAVLASVLFRGWMFADLNVTENEITTALVDFVREGIRINHDRPLRS